MATEKTRTAGGKERRRTTKTSDTVALQIVHDIMERGLVAGDRLPSEAMMLEEYRVSRGSLREALRLLEAQGLISLKPGPGGGPIVGVAESENLSRTSSLYFHLGGMTYAELFATQEELEPILARLAAQNPQREAAMAPYLEGYQIPHGGPEYHTGTRNFHADIRDLANNKVLAIYAAAVTHLISTDILAVMEPVDLYGQIIDEHGTLARLIYEGKAAEAEICMREHFQSQHEYVMRRWPSRLAELVEWR